MLPRANWLQACGASVPEVPARPPLVGWPAVGLLRLLRLPPLLLPVLPQVVNHLAKNLNIMTSKVVSSVSQANRVVTVTTTDNQVRGPLG